MGDQWPPAEIGMVWLKLQIDPDNTISFYRVCHLLGPHRLSFEEGQPGLTTALTVPQDSRNWSWIPETVQVWTESGWPAPALWPWVTFGCYHDCYGVTVTP